MSWSADEVDEHYSEKAGGLIKKWRFQAAALDDQAKDDPPGSLRLATQRIARTLRGCADELEEAFGLG